jgi:RNA polymerase sigma-70 factor (ECF subfamily)
VEQAAGLPAIDPDRELVLRTLAGERHAFESLLLRHYSRIHRLAWRLTGSQTEAEDIAQDVCCALVEKLGSFKGEAKFATWLIGITMNACRDHRRRRMTSTRFHDGLTVLNSLSIPADGRDLYRQSWLASNVSRLGAALQETVVLVVAEELTHAEAARALGIAETTVSWRMHEARRQLARSARRDGTDDIGV